MNRTKIEWTDYSWNPVTGCRHGCPYCYARKITKRFPKGFPNGFEPTFHENRLTEPEKVKSPSMIFTVSMGDLFGDWVPSEWIESVFEVMELPVNRKHTFQILTKNPKRIVPALYGNEQGCSPFGGGDFLPNVWLGTSVESVNSLYRIDDLRKLKEQAPCWTIFVSFEPLLEEMPADLDLSGIDWIIIGAQTNPLKPPSIEMMASILKKAKENHIPVFFKDTVVDIWPELLREFPEVKSGDGNNPENQEVICDA